MNNISTFENGYQELINIKVVNNNKYINIVLDALGQIGESLNMSSKDVYKLKLATEEAITNLFTFTFEQDEVAYYTIGIGVVGCDIYVSIKDKSKPLDFSTLKFDSTHTEGLSVLLMHTLVDEVEIKQRSTGREQLLIKHLDKLPKYKKQTKKQLDQVSPDTKFIIRPIREDEMINVSQCVYDEYGYTYAYDIIYYPKAFAEACKNGEIHSIVVITEEGEVAGHIALMLDPKIPGIAEMGIAVVKRKFRKCHLITPMCKYIIDYARDELKLNGLYAQPVLHHTITQHMANKNGLTPCYFILNYTSFSSTINNSGERRSLACAIRNFKEEQIKTIYVPKQVMHIIESVYLNACIKRRFSAEQKIESETNCTLSIKESQQLAKIYLSSAGDNWKQQLKQFLLSVKKSNCKVIEMYMNLLSPSIPYAYNIAIDFDFFCTGVLPLSTEGDFLMMQCTLSDVVEYDKLCTIEPYSSMLSQIKLLDPNEQ